MTTAIRSAHVVGAGPTGLTIAGALARAGVRVTLYEATPRTGGTWAGSWDPGGGGYTKHSPQVAWGAYVEARKVLASYGLDWNRDFVSRRRCAPWQRAVNAEQH